MKNKSNNPKGLVVPRVKAVSNTKLNQALSQKKRIRGKAAGRYPNQIAFYRKQRGLLQQQLGELLGVSQITVSEWERGIKIPRPEYILEMAKAFNITHDELMKGQK